MPMWMSGADCSGDGVGSFPRRRLSREGFDAHLAAGGSRSRASGSPTRPHRHRRRPLSRSCSTPFETAWAVVLGLGGEGVGVQRLVPGGGQHGGDAAPTRPRVAAVIRPAWTRWWAALWSQQLRPSKNRSGSAPSWSSRPARGHGAQDRSVASAEGARGGHGGLRWLRGGLWCVTRSVCRPRTAVRTHRRDQQRVYGRAGNPAHPVRPLAGRRRSLRPTPTAAGRGATARRWCCGRPGQVGTATSTVGRGCRGRAIRIPDTGPARRGGAHSAAARPFSGACANSATKAPHASRPVAAMGPAHLDTRKISGRTGKNGRERAPCGPR